MLMSTSALPPTSTEKVPTLYPSLLQRVSRAISYNTLGEPFLVLIIVIILFGSFLQSLRAVFVLRLRKSVFVCRSSVGLQKDAEETVGTEACCLILALTLLKPVMV